MSGDRRWRSKSAAGKGRLARPASRRSSRFHLLGRWCGSKASNAIGRPLGLCRRNRHRFRVLPEAVPPAIDVAGRVRKVRVVESERRAAERGGELGHQFLAAVVAGAELDLAVHFGAVQPADVAGGVPEFVEEGGVVGVGADERLQRRDLHSIARRAVPSGVPTLGNARRLRHRANDAFGRLDPLSGHSAIQFEVRQFQTLALLDVEDTVVAKDRDRPLGAVISLIGPLLDLFGFPKDCDRGVLAASDVAAELIGLAVCEPAMISVGSDAKKKDVDPAVRPQSERIARQTSRFVPRLSPRNDPALESLEDLGRDGLVDRLARRMFCGPAQMARRSFDVWKVL
jgi:hypothetical protein